MACGNAVPDPSLVDRTNVSSPESRLYSSVGLPALPSERKRGSQPELSGHEKKRIKLEWPKKKQGRATQLSDDDTDDDEQGSCTRTGYAARASRFSVYSSTVRVALGNPSRTSHGAYLPTRPILQSFVSSNKSDIFRCYSDNVGSFVNIPYACSYSNAAKRGDRPLLAVATEQGSVDVMDTSKRNDWDFEPQRITLQPHANGIFDVKWSPSDTLIATASGDHSIRITTLSSSVPSQERVLHTLRGHEGTVKTVAWDPSRDGDILCTGGRDGAICLWDLRVGERSVGDEVVSVLSIPKAHDLERKPARSRTSRGKVVAGTPLPAITHLLYTDTHPHGVVSSCSSDGILNLWDLRLPSANTRTRSKKTAKQHPKPLFTSADPTAYGGVRRGRGITTLAHGTGPTASLVFALGTDSRVHTYSLPSLDILSGCMSSATAGADGMEMDDPHAFYDSRMKTSSFYVRMAASPCGRWLACGDAVDGKASLYDVTTAGRARSVSGMRAVELKGQTGEVGAVDWADGLLATCADDGTVRVWRPDLDVSRQCRDDPEEMKWNWAWSTDA